MTDQKQPCSTIVVVVAVVVLGALPSQLCAGAAVQLPWQLTGNTVVAAAAVGDVDDDDTAAQLLLGLLIHVTTAVGT